MYLFDFSLDSTTPTCYIYISVAVVMYLLLKWLRQVVFEAFVEMLKKLVLKE